MTNKYPVAINLDAREGLSAYIQVVNKAPILSAEEECALAIRYRDQNDLDAAKQLILSHLRHVVKVARGFMGYGLPLTDLIQEGSIGLMKAVKRFDPSRNVRLVSFAVHWIRAEIYDYVLRNWRLVKVATTKAQRKLFFNLRKSRTRLGWMKDAEVRKLAEDLNVQTSTVRDMESRLSGTDITLNGGDDSDDNNAVLSPAQYLGDSRYDPAHTVASKQEGNQRNTQLKIALQQLDDRSRDIVTRRWLQDDKPTLHQLADEYKISAERIRQIEKRALENMKGAIEA